MANRRKVFCFGSGNCEEQINLAKNNIHHDLKLSKGGSDGSYLKVVKYSTIPFKFQNFLQTCSLVASSISLCLMQRFRQIHFKLGPLEAPRKHTVPLTPFFFARRPLSLNIVPRLSFYIGQIGKPATLITRWRRRFICLNEAFISSSPYKVAACQPPWSKARLTCT